MKEINSEQIILLNESGAVIGSAPKLASHHAETPLHLAFSAYIFNNEGKLLVTRRADSKKVWNGVWTNSCCGHPAPGENIEDAIKRRVDYELGINIHSLILVVADYRYKTPPFKGIIENEVCPIYFARTEDTPHPNSLEVAGHKWVTWHDYVKLIKQDKTDQWSWWCKDQNKHLISLPELTSYSHQNA